MTPISDRTVVGTIRGCLARKVEPYVGPRGPERLACSREALGAFVAGAARLELPGWRRSDDLLVALQEALSFALCERPDRLHMAVSEARNYRKRTDLTQVDRDGAPWLILKAFAEDAIGHQCLRAYREVEGARAFGGLEGVVAPQVVQVFSLHGEGLPNHVLLVAETFLPGRTILQRMSEPPGPGTSPDFFLRAARNSGRLLRRIHDATARDEADCTQGLLDELTGFVAELTDAGVLGPALRDRALACLGRRRPALEGCPSVLAHRDFTVGNVMVDEDGDVVLVDLEKSDREFAGKDVAKFTETLYVDAALMGYGSPEEEALRAAFLDGYGVRPEEEAPIAFYQLYTALAMARFHLRRHNERALDRIVRRIEELARSYPSSQGWSVPEAHSVQEPS